MDTLITDILLLLPNYLSCKAVLSLYQTCKRLNSIYFNFLFKYKTSNFGTELSFNPSKYSLCYKLENDNNTLLCGKYYLKDNITLKHSLTSFFIIKGNVNLNFNGKTIAFEEGILFDCKEGEISFHNGTIEICNEGYLVLITPKVDSLNNAKTIYTHKQYKNSTAICFRVTPKTTLEIDNVKLIKKHTFKGKLGAIGPTGDTGCTRNFNGDIKYNKYDKHNKYNKYNKWYNKHNTYKNKYNKNY